jgi:hypothetical protein
VTLYFNDDSNAAYTSIMGVATIHTDPANPEAKRVYERGNRDFYWPDFPEGFVMIEVKPRWLEHLGTVIAANEKTWRPQGVVFPAPRW